MRDDDENFFEKKHTFYCCHYILYIHVLRFLFSFFFSPLKKLILKWFLILFFGVLFLRKRFSQLLHFAIPPCLSMNIHGKSELRNTFFYVLSMEILRQKGSYAEKTRRKFCASSLRHGFHAKWSLIPFFYAWETMLRRDKQISLPWRYNNVVLWTVKSDKEEFIANGRNVSLLYFRFKGFFKKSSFVELNCENFGWRKLKIMFKSGTSL